MLEKTTFKTYLPYFIITITYLIFSLPSSPFFEGLGWDREIFQYIGMTIKNNLHPYSDTFDHKPPVIYLLNYLGVLLTPNSTWGIYLIMNVIGFFSSILIYQLSLLKNKKVILSIIITVLFISLINYPSLVQGGNLTRQFTTFLNTIILFIVFSTKKSKFNCAFLGFLIGVIFFTQQNEILSGSVLIIYYLLFDNGFTFYPLRKSLLKIGYFILGLLIPFTSILLIINHWNNFDDFINQVFLFNFDSYVNKEPFFKKVLNVCYIFFTKLLPGVAIVVLLLGVNLSYIINKGKKIKITPSLVVIAVSLILQIISTSISGQLYGHYFLMFIPYIICIFIFFSKYKNCKYLDFCLYGLAIIVIAISLTRIILYRKPDKSLYKLVIEKVDSVKNTSGQFYTFDTGYLRVNFELNINSPSKYVYTHFFDKEQYNSLIKDFEINNTKYILLGSKENISKELKLFISSNYNEEIKYNDYILYQKRN